MAKTPARTIRTKAMAMTTSTIVRAAVELARGRRIYVKPAAVFIVLIT
jgi:hypothetical protein